jgi:glycosyltransferase involved in cell wall biosynthesis
MTSRVTVLIPNYNGSRYLEHCLDGLVDQTIADFACHFLDDGSVDSSLEIARRYQALIPQMEIHAFENAGIAANWNRGIDLVESEYFSLLHCDDKYHPRYLEVMLELMDSQPESGLGHCASQAIDADSNEIFSIIEYYKHALFLPEKQFERDLDAEYRMLLKGDFINCPSVIFRADATKGIGRFNEQLEQTLDWDYWFRAVQAGHKICGTNEKLYYYRRHDNNHTVTNSKSMARYFEELTCLQVAHQEGVRLGIIAEKIDLSGLRNIVLVDLSAALRSGNIEVAVSLSDFLQTKLGVNQFLVRFIRTITYGGKFGGYCLQFSSNVAIVALAAVTRMRQLWR